MSLFSAVIMPMLERQIKALEPQIAFFLISQLKNVCAEVLEWAETKINIDLNGDGIIGDKNETR